MNLHKHMNLIIQAVHDIPATHLDRIAGLATATRIEQISAPCLSLARVETARCHRDFLPRSLA
ncbi:MAG: DUF4072 domain-containing protein [Nitrosomonadales bacterium]